MSTATSTATLPRRGRPSKKLHDVARWDELRQLGWTSKGSDGDWFAEHPDYDEIGPAQTIGALVTAVKLAIGNKFDLPKDEGLESIGGGSIELDANSKGERFLPGTGPVVNKQLSDAVLKYHTAKMERVAATAKETAAMDELKAVGKIHEHLYMDDPKKPGTKIYRVDDIIDRITTVAEEKHTTEAIKGDKE